MTKHQQILVVEDEKHLAAGLKYNLEAEGYRVLVAGDGTNALRLVETTDVEIDLIILDLMLPGMSGYALCEKLRGDGRQMPVLILSARTLAEDKARGFDVGANQYLTKPFDLDELLSRVKNLLALGPIAPIRATQRPVQSGLERESCSFSDCIVDFNKFTLTRSGKSNRLTALQMKFLKYLIGNANRVVPRAELLRHVWEMPATVQTRAPDQILRQLRKLCELNPAEPRHLLTIRDAGYMFVPEPAEE